MTIEVATFVSDLASSNPGAGDLVSQGDDHLRLLKSVLQSTFPGASKAFYFPVTAAKSADFTVVAADMNKTFLVTTTGGLVNMTLPTLASGDAGWECFMLKATTDANPVMVKPPSGTLTSGAIPSLAAARRCIPSSKISCYWTGSLWVIGRAASVAGPVGSCIEYHGSSLPFGFEWPNGQTLASAATAYPEYNAVIGSGVTLDKRSRLGIPLDNLGGSAAGRLGGGVITGTAIGNVGGVDVVTLDATMIPSHTHTGVTGVESNDHTHSSYGNTNNLSAQGPYVNVGAGNNQTNPLNTGGRSATHTHAFTTNATGGGLSHSNLQPSIMVAQLLVVE